MSTRRVLTVVGTVAVVIAVAALAVAAGFVRGSARTNPDDQAAPTGPASDVAGRTRADLAARLGVGADEISVEDARAETWNDASLGLPEPDMLYAQVVTSGHVVTLSHRENTYVYHVAGETLKLKTAAPQDNPAGPAPASPVPDVAERARADLAARLGIAAEEIAVDSVQEETWGDTSLGLPEPGMMYAQVITDGHVVTLSHGGRTYVYHVAGEIVKLKPQIH